MSTRNLTTKYYALKLWNYTTKCHRAIVLTFEDVIAEKHEKFVKLLKLETQHHTVSEFKIYHI